MTLFDSYIKNVHQIDFLKFSFGLVFTNKTTLRPKNFSVGLVHKQEKMMYN